MWVAVMFDLPTNTKAQRKAYSEFRKHLLKDGFLKMQFSVYKRYCTSRDNADAHVRRVTNHLPSGGEVRILAITEKQFEKMLIFWGRRAAPSEIGPRQLALF